MAVVLASPCYPFGEGETRRFLVPADGFLNKDPSQCAFGAAVREERGQMFTGKGRILTFVARADDFVKARKKVYRAIESMADTWEGVQYRRDIGQQLS